jgi:hypothetical protein
MLLVFETDGSIAVTNSGSTVVITNANNEVVANTGLVAGTYTLPLPQTVVTSQILVLLPQVTIISTKTPVAPTAAATLVQ